MFKRVLKDGKMIKIFFQDFSRTGETFIYTFDANTLAFFWDNELMNAQQLYQQLAQSKKTKTKKNKIFNESLDDSQSISAVLKLLRMNSMKDSLMIICKGQKTYGDASDWFFKSKHAILFFPQEKTPNPQNGDEDEGKEDSVQKFHVIDWDNQNICSADVKTARQMAYMKAMGGSDHFPSFVIVKNVCITNIKSMFKMTDANGDELVFGYDDNEVEDVNGNIRPLNDTDEVSYNIRCSLRDFGSEDFFGNMLVTAWTNGGESLFGKTAKEAYEEHGSAGWYEDDCKNLVFDLILKGWTVTNNNFTRAGWTIEHLLNYRNQQVANKVVLSGENYQSDTDELQWEEEQEQEVEGEGTEVDKGEETEMDEGEETEIDEEQQIQERNGEETEQQIIENSMAKYKEPEIVNTGDKMDVDPVNNVNEYFQQLASLDVSMLNSDL